MLNNQHTPSYSKDTSVESSLKNQFNQQLLKIVGDTDGDKNKFNTSLQNLGVIDHQGDITGSNHTVLIVGDITSDKSGEGAQILERIATLQNAAARIDSDIILLDGNHDYDTIGFITGHNCRKETKETHFGSDIIQDVLLLYPKYIELDNESFKKYVLEKYKHLYTGQDQANQKVIQEKILKIFGDAYHLNIQWFVKSNLQGLLGLGRYLYGESFTEKDLHKLANKDIIAEQNKGKAFLENMCLGNIIYLHNNIIGTHAGINDDTCELLQKICNEKDMSIHNAVSYINMIYIKGKKNLLLGEGDMPDEYNAIVECIIPISNSGIIHKPSNLQWLIQQGVKIEVRGHNAYQPNLEIIKQLQSTADSVDSILTYEDTSSLSKKIQPDCDAIYRITVDNKGDDYSIATYDQATKKVAFQEKAIIQA